MITKDRNPYRRNKGEEKENRRQSGKRNT